MYSFAFSFLALTALLISMSVSEELNAVDVPSACTTICGPIVQLTDTCNIDPGESEDDAEDSDSGNDTPETDEVIESQCICTNMSFDVAGIAGLCASCIQQYGNGTVDGEQILISPLRTKSVGDCFRVT
jgi:hypothetical protein